ncbi:23S rRNA pseudouridine2605 synthase [Sphingomonas gellani]|uniref:Pseudouridine synthase n=1 Tax=Sphingomonas gellani TaxID=1166340 RepID=A0A1H8EL45_9SPHN|nr:pseudouridine synthase [Sphingomonas gellani]SEN19528.1 23S rRNA pseudouridine2605 synthase [Sphingomonas gellani]
MTAGRKQDHSTADDRRGERIAKLLARAGVASRREVERMIAEGRVARNGTVVDTPNTVLPSLTGVTVDGQPVAAPEAARLFLFHKPVSLLVTERDPAGRPTIYDRLPADLPRVVPVGRLDLNTEGLLLLTTDGELKRQLELPATGVERTYRARAYGPVTQAQLEELIDGIEIEGVRYGSIDANLERRTGANVWIEMTLAEGKNREVRRVLEHLGLQVGRLIRTRYGPFLLGDLQPGEIGEVRQNDLVSFRQALAGKRHRQTEPIAPVPIRQSRRDAEDASDEPSATARAAGDRPTSRPRPDEPRRPRAAAGVNRPDHTARSDAPTRPFQQRPAGSGRPSSAAPDRRFDQGEAAPARGDRVRARATSSRSDDRTDARTQPNGRRPGRFGDERDTRADAGERQNRTRGTTGRGAAGRGSAGLDLDTPRGSRDDARRPFPTRDAHSSDNRSRAAARPDTRADRPRDAARPGTRNRSTPRNGSPDARPPRPSSGGSPAGGRGGPKPPRGNKPRTR